MSVTGFNMRRREVAAQQEAAAQLGGQAGPVVIESISNMPYSELRALAKERQIEEYYRMSTEELREALKEGGINVTTG